MIRQIFNAMVVHQLIKSFYNGLSKSKSWKVPETFLSLKLDDVPPIPPPNQCCKMSRFFKGENT